jgi:ABC-type Fe3+/spermidine/putrescine transport system ATPase subunit
MSQAGIRLEAVSVGFGRFSLQNIDLTVDEGERLVLIGQNGAGKSVTLETIAGFHRLKSGRITIGGRDVTHLPPERRNVGFMLQNFGLFPHLSVAGNIGLGLHGRQRGAQAREQIARLLREFGIEHLATRHPQSLSPGEKQRAGLARARAAAAALFMFDEPFSALDAETHARLRHDLRDFLDENGSPAILVTHDWRDAHAWGTKLAILRDGAVVQTGKVDAMFRAPNSRFVAAMLGVENILPARLTGMTDGWAIIEIGGIALRAALPVGGLTGPNLLAAIRAEDLDIIPPGGHAPPDTNRLTAQVASIVSEGVLTRVDLQCGCPLQARIMSRLARNMNALPGIMLDIAITPDAIRLLPDEP